MLVYKNEKLFANNNYIYYYKVKYKYLQGYLYLIKYFNK